MAKKIMTLLIVALAFTSAAVAQEGAAPKVSVELVQRMDTELNQGEIGGNILSDTDPLGTRTEVKGSVTFDLGSGVTLVPYIKDRFEVKLAAEDGAVFANDRNRNRIYLGLDSNFAFDAAFNLGVNLEYRLATNVRENSAPSKQEHRFMPSLVLKGKIDMFYYGINQGLPIILDVNEDEDDNSSVSLDGVYNAGLSFKLSDKESLKLDITNLLVVTNQEAVDGGAVDSILNNFYFKAIYSTHGFSPAVGFTYASNSDEDGELTDSVIGATVGFDFAKDNWSLGSNFQLGVNSEKDNQPEFQASVILKIKI